MSRRSGSRFADKDLRTLKRSIRSGPSGAVHPLVQISQDAGGHAPDVTLLVWHGVVLALDALPLARMALVVLRSHQEVERHLERVGDRSEEHTSELQSHSFISYA